MNKIPSFTSSHIQFRHTKRDLSRVGVSKSTEMHWRESLDREKDLAGYMSIAFDPCGRRRHFFYITRVKNNSFLRLLGILH